jgi:hypothetical protein
VAQIFVSYASADREWVAPLAKALADRGWSVWWDRQIPPGKTFDEVIETALNQAKAVVVVWSESGVASQWVRTEAAEGETRQILVPVLMEKVVPPLAFRRIQAADLTDWRPGDNHPGFTELVSALDELIGDETAAMPVVENEDPTVQAISADRARMETEERDEVIALPDQLEKASELAEHPEAVEALSLARRKREAAEPHEEAEVLDPDGLVDETRTGREGQRTAAIGVAAAEPAAKVTQSSSTKTAGRVESAWTYIRTTTPGWWLGVLAVVSAYLPWLNTGDEGWTTSFGQPALYPWTHESPVKLAFPIVVLGVFIAVVAAQEQQKWRRGAGIALCAVPVLYVFNVLIRDPYQTQKVLTSVGPYAAVTIGLLTVFSNLGRRPHPGEPKPWAEYPRPVRLMTMAMILGGSLIAIAGLVLNFFVFYQPSFSMRATAAFGLGDLDVSSPLVSIGVFTLVILGVYLIATLADHRRVVTAPISSAAAILLLLARPWEKVLVDRDIPLSGVFQSGYWATLVGVLVLLLAVPLSQIVFGSRKG